MAQGELFVEVAKVNEIPPRKTSFRKCLQRMKLHNKAFWIWNIDEHRKVDIKTNRDYCFNHIIGLPQKDGVDKPLYDYEKIIFDSLVIQDDTKYSNSKHLWIKKATELT